MSAIKSQIRRSQQEYDDCRYIQTTTAYESHVRIEKNEQLSFRLDVSGEDYSHPFSRFVHHLKIRLCAVYIMTRVP